MPSSDTELYEKLVLHQSDERLLENLLAYYFYQDTKLKAVSSSVLRNRYIPSEDVIAEVLSTDEYIAEYRDRAKVKLRSQILVEIDSNRKAASFWSRAKEDFIFSLLTDTAKTVLFYILTFIIIQSGILYSLYSHLSDIAKLFPSIKEIICR